jgi:hypothetical protein
MSFSKVFLPYELVDVTLEIGGGSKLKGCLTIPGNQFVRAVIATFGKSDVVAPSIPEQLSEEQSIFHPEMLDKEHEDF